MPLKIAHGEGGTNGATVQTTDTTSGTQLDIASVTGAGTYTYSITSQAHGSMGYNTNCGTTSTATLGWAGDNSPNAAARTYIRLQNTPSGTSDILSIRNSGGGTAKFQLNNARRIGVADITGNIVTFTTVLVVGVWYRVEMQVVIGTGTTDGTVNAQIFMGDSPTALETTANTNRNTGTTNFVGMRWGKLTSAPSANIDWDDTAFIAGTTTPIGAVAPGSMLHMF